MRAVKAGIFMFVVLVITACTDDSITPPEQGVKVPPSTILLAYDEEEVYGNIYFNGVQDTSSLYYVSLVPIGVETESRLVGTFDTIMYQTHGRTFAFGWFDAADSRGGRCGTLESYLDPATSDSGRGTEVHAAFPGIIGGGKEGHCIRPGRYRIAVSDGGEGPVRSVEIDYVQVGGYPYDTTPGAPNSSLLVENTTFDPAETGLADNVVHFDLTSGAFVDSAVLQI